MQISGSIASDKPLALPGADTDPCPVYAEMRDLGEVHVVQEPTGLRRWTLVQYDEARRALADDRMSKGPAQRGDELHRAGYLTGNSETDQYMFHILNSDPPDRTRLRRITLKAMNASRISAMRARIQEVADCPPAGRCRLTVSCRPYCAFALPFAVTVMGELLGVPAEDLDDYHACASAALVCRVQRAPR